MGPGGFAPIGLLRSIPFSLACFPFDCLSIYMQSVHLNLLLISQPIVACHLTLHWRSQVAPFSGSMPSAPPLRFPCNLATAWPIPENRSPPNYAYPRPPDKP